MLPIPARIMSIPVGFDSRLDEGMGPKLKRKLKRHGVHLLFGVVKKRAGSQPRFVEKFTSRLVINGKGWFSASHAEQETGPFDKCIFAFERTMHSRLCYYPSFQVEYPSS
jgi:hypothetical protein